MTLLLATSSEAWSREYVPFTSTGLTYAAGWFSAPEMHLAGDFNGDGKDDLVWFGFAGQLILMKSNGTVFEHVPAPDTQTPYTDSQNYFSGFGRRAVGDFNGDGKSDIAFFDTDGDIHVWRANDTGTGFVSAGTTSTSFNAQAKYFEAPEQRLVGHFNGDTKSDIAFFGIDGSISVMLAHVSSAGDVYFQPSPTVTQTAFTQAANWFNAPGHRLVGKFDNDDKWDVAFLSAMGGIYVYSNRSPGGDDVSFAQDLTLPVPIGSFTQTGHTHSEGWFDTYERRLPGDFNGDGLTDIAYFDDNGYILFWLANGHGFTFAGSSYTSGTKAGGWFGHPGRRVVGNFRGEMNGLNRLDGLALFSDSGDVQNWNIRPINPQRGVAKFYFKHSWGDPNGDVLLGLPDVFAMFEGVRPITVPSPTPPWRDYHPIPPSVASKPQEVKMRYVQTAVSYEPKQEMAVPLKYTDFEAEEDNFLHASDPAGLVVTPSGSSIQLDWLSDDRTSSLGVQSYRISRYVSSSEVVPHDPTWSGRSWQTVATVSAMPSTSSGARSAHAYLDANVSQNVPGSVGKFVCYRIQSVNATGPHAYSLPRCLSFTGTTPRPAVSFMNATTVVQGVEDILLPGGGLDENRVRVIYDVQARFRVSDPATALEAHVWQGRYTHAPFSGSPAQFSERFTAEGGDLGTLDTRTVNGDVVTLRKTLAVTLPYMKTPAYTGPGYFPGEPGRPHEDLVFQVRWSFLTPQNQTGSATHPGADTYFTVHPNHRIRERVWMGYYMNPWSEQWAAGMADEAEVDRAVGYNALFIDNWFAVQGSVLSPFGTSLEAQPVEFYYPRNPSNPTDPYYYSDPSQVPGFTDPWAEALVTLSQRVRAQAPNVLLIGNALREISCIQGVCNTNQNPDFGNRSIERATSSLDGVMFEACLDMGGAAPVSGDRWLAHLALVEKYAAKGQMVICLAYAKDDKERYPESELDAQRRLYKLGSALLLKQLHSNIYYGGPELNPSFGTPEANLNAFPEFSLQLGVAQESRRQVPVSTDSPSAHCFARQFTQGYVVVNASPTDGCKVTLPWAHRRVSIQGVSATGVKSAGYVEYGTPQQTVVLSAQEAGIFVNP